MQTATCAVSPCTPLIKVRRPSPASLNPSLRLRPATASPLAYRPPIHGLPRLSRSPRTFSWISDPPPLDSDRGRAEGLTVRASSVPESAGVDSAKSSGALQTLQLGALFGLWYLFNIYFNIYNKQVLKVFHYPMTITTFQFAVGSIFALFMWATNLYRRPQISSAQLVAILPLAMVHTFGNLFTNMSLGKVAVSFTHTIKAMEPFFSVILSALFLGETPTFWVLSSLVPIVGGVALASITEASFNWAGFWSAMASDLSFQTRNVLSKKFMVKK